MSVTDELNELIAEYGERDALNRTLAHLSAAKAEIIELKAQLFHSDEMSGKDTADYIAISAELARLQSESTAQITEGRRIVNANGDFTVVRTSEYLAMIGGWDYHH
jgi:hypothetical protein